MDRPFRKGPPLNGPTASRRPAAEEQAESPRTTRGGAQPVSARRDDPRGKAQRTARPGRTWVVSSGPTGVVSSGPPGGDSRKGPPSADHPSRTAPVRTQLASNGSSRSTEVGGRQSKRGGACAWRWAARLTSPSSANPEGPARRAGRPAPPDRPPRPKQCGAEPPPWPAAAAQVVHARRPPRPCPEPSLRRQRVLAYSPTRVLRHPGQQDPGPDGRAAQARAPTKAGRTVRSDVDGEPAPCPAPRTDKLSPLGAPPRPGCRHRNRPRPSRSFIGHRVTAGDAHPPPQPPPGSPHHRSRHRVGAAPVVAPGWPRCHVAATETGTPTAPKYAPEVPAHPIETP